MQEVAPKLALECPAYLLKEIQPMGDFDFALTHLVLKSKVYSNYYRLSGRFKMLDNSTNENLRPCSMDQIVKAAGLIEPNYVMPPDFLGDPHSTLRGLQEALVRLGKATVFPILQGGTVWEALKLGKAIAKLGIDRVAVPYDITSLRTDSNSTMSRNRIKVIRHLGSLEVFEWFHLLGITTLQEFEFYKDYPVRTVDTGVPILLAMLGQDLGLYGPPPKNNPTMVSMGRVDTRKTLSLELARSNVALLKTSMEVMGSARVPR